MRTRISAFAVLLLATGCKPQAGSEVQSLENFSAGTLLRKNICFGDRETIEPRDMNDFPLMINSTESKKDELETVARSALSAIPYDMKTLVALAGGKLLITRDAAKVCGKNRLRSGSDSGSFASQTSCFLDIKTKGTPASGLTIVISDNAAYINHILVRTFAYALSQKFAWQFMTSKANGKLTDVNPFEYDDIRDEVVAAYLQDMAVSKIFDLAKLERLMGADAEKIILRNKDQLNGKNLDKLFAKLTWSNKKGMQLTRSLAPTIADAFKDFVVGEAFDSYHCAAFGDYDEKVAAEIKRSGNVALFAKLKNTRKVMEDFFPRTHKAYLRMDAHFMRLGRAARNSFMAAAGGPTLGPVETNSQSQKTTNNSARGGSFSLAGESGGFALADTTTQAQRDAWDRSARSSPAYQAAQQRIADLQQKKSEAWVAGGYRYDESIQQAQFDAQKVWRAQFHKVQAAETKQPVVDNYKPQEFVTQREAFNQGLDEHLAKTQKAVNDKFAEGAAAGQQFKEELITYSNNTGSPTMAALAAGSAELVGGVGDLSTQVAQGVNNGFHSAAKGVVNTTQGAYDTAQGTSEFIHDASIIYRSTDGDMLDKAAAVSSATTTLAGKKIVEAGDATVAEFDRMKGAYNDASARINAPAEASVANGTNPYWAATDAVGRNLSDVGEILPGPMKDVAPFTMLENTYVGGEAMAQGDFAASRRAFGDVLVEGGTEILTDAAKDKMSSIAYDTATSKSGPFAAERRTVAANVLQTQNQLSDQWENAVVGGAPAGSTEQWARQGFYDNAAAASEFIPDAPVSSGGLLETYRESSAPTSTYSEPAPTYSQPEPTYSAPASEPSYTAPAASSQTTAAPSSAPVFDEP